MAEKIATLIQQNAFFDIDELIGLIYEYDSKSPLYNIELSEKRYKLHIYQKRGVNMVTAIVLLHVERKSINKIAETISGIEGVSEVYSVSGRYDLLAMVRTKDNELLSEVVTNRILQVDGIIESETMLAFKCFSQFELEKFFSVGS